MYCSFASTKRPTAFMFWSTPQDSPSLEFPSVPLVGVRIYVPKLKFKLPFIIPDVNIDDLRTMELPEPLLEMSYLREHRYPDWIETDDSFNFRRWTGHGEVPSGIRAQFPDR